MHKTKKKIEPPEHHLPLIDRILIIGLQISDIENFFKNKTNKRENIKSLKMKILEEYKSALLTEDDNDPLLYENIPKLCLPEGILLNTFHDNDSSIIIPFSLLSKGKLKHVSALHFYENYTENMKNFAIQKVIALVSSRDMYQTHRSILQNIYSIMMNYYINKHNHPEKIRSIWMSNTNQTFQEYRLLDFYFAFLLNSLTITIPNDTHSSFCLYNIPNNKSAKYYLQYNISDSAAFPLKDYEMSLLLDRFRVEDLIILYQSMIMEYKILIIFENYEEINIILYSLINLIYPLKWNYLIISFLLNETEMMLDAPFPLIMGVHKKYLPIINSRIKKDQFSPETIIYDLTSKSFLFLNNTFPELPAKVNSELKSGLYFLLSEKLLMKSDVSLDTDSEMAKILKKEELCSKINPMIYFNLKLISLFYLTFLELVKTIKSNIKYDKIKDNQSNVLNMQISDYFDLNKYIINFKMHYSISVTKYINFIKNFSKSLMFNNFIQNFIIKSSSKPKYKCVNDLIEMIKSSGDKYRSSLKNKLGDIIHNKILNYYNFRYIDLSDVFKSFIKKIGKNNVASVTNTKDYIIWTPLENYKISSFNVFYEAFPNKPKDNEELLMIHHMLESSQIVTIEGIDPINQFDWSEIAHVKHKKTSSSINKAMKVSNINDVTEILLEENMIELMSSSSAKVNLIGNVSKKISLKKNKGKKVGQYDMPLQMIPKNVPKPGKKVPTISTNNSNTIRNEEKRSPYPSNKFNGNVPKHQGDDECDLFSDNEQE